MVTARDTDRSSHRNPKGPKGRLMKEISKVRKFALVGDYLPRRCGIATFTADLLSAVAIAFPQSRCISISVNDVKGDYQHPEVVRFEIEERIYGPICAQRTSLTSVM
jgi:hypothetical protein